ncbi:MAG: class I SAM-dependent methyltransferase [Nitrospirota bacterium]|nr:class I SAM-dependent methyltransferase [Nitrospirota bacterium]MDP3595567.1 class I SAM-dependent methyltransferase [Nitrospirota bacterium]
MTLSLLEYYQSLGLSASQWHVGPEHPYLEEYVIRLLRTLPAVRVLEIGYQSGGFAVPVILAMQGRSGFDYLGVDSLRYANAVHGGIIADYLKTQGVTSGFQFIESDASKFLSRKHSGQFDLILIDHYKPLYPRELLAVFASDRLGPQGVVLLHDISGRARGVAVLCEAIASAYGYTWAVVEEVPEGLAVLRSRGWDSREYHRFSRKIRRGVVRVLVGIQRLVGLAREVLRSAKRKVTSA